MNLWPLIRRNTGNTYLQENLKLEYLFIVFRKMVFVLGYLYEFNKVFINDPTCK